MDKLLVIQVIPCEMYMDDLGRIFHLKGCPRTMLCDICGEQVGDGSVYESKEGREVCHVHKACMEVVVPIRMFKAYREKLRRDEGGECPKCGGSETDLLATPDIIHYGKLVCCECGAFIKWANKPRGTGGEVE